MKHLIFRFLYKANRIFRLSYFYLQSLNSHRALFGDLGYHRRINLLLLTAWYIYSMHLSPHILEMNYRNIGYHKGLAMSIRSASDHCFHKSIHNPTQVPNIRILRDYISKDTFRLSFRYLLDRDEET